jgi:hypothetical protein
MPWVLGAGGAVLAVALLGLLAALVLRALRIGTAEVAARPSVVASRPQPSACQRPPWWALVTRSSQNGQHFHVTTVQGDWAWPPRVCSTLDHAGL